MPDLNIERCRELIAISRADKFSFLQHIEFAEQLAAALAEIDRLRQLPCPYIKTCEEGTNYCALAEGMGADDPIPPAPGNCFE